MCRSITLTLAVLLLAAASCGGSGGHPNDNANSSSLAAALSSLEQAAPPAGVEPALYRRLQDELARVLRQRGELRFASAPPSGDWNSVKDLRLSQHGDGKWYLDWTYVNVGDGDQNSEVNISDLTPIGSFFGARLGDANWDAAQIADGDGNGEVNLADITPIGMNFLSKLAGYNVYGSADHADLPENNGGSNGSGTAALGFIDFDSATKGGSALKGSSAAGGRLCFSVEVAPSAQNPYYWVTSVEAQGGAEGVPGVAGGGDPLTAPVLSLTNPPGGTGTEASPYQADSTADYIFTLTDATDGNVSTAADTEYYLSDHYAGSISIADASLNLPDRYGGDFCVWATYQGRPVAWNGALWFHAEPLFSPSDLQLTATVPAWVTGSGTAADPYANPALWHAGDIQTQLTVTDPADGNVTGSAAFSVENGVGSVSGTGTLSLRDDIPNWGEFHITANYQGKQARLYFDITRALQLGLTSPPGLGAGTQDDPYVADISTAFDITLSEVDDGIVSGGTDTSAGGRTDYYLGDTYPAPEDMGWLYGNWVTKDVAGNSALTGFQDSFAGGADKPCWLLAHYSRDRVDGQGNPYSESADSNKVWFILAAPGLIPPDGFHMYTDALTGDPILFTETMWLSETEGYGTAYDPDNIQNWCDVYHSTDAGATWTKLGRAEGRNGGNNASMWLNMWPDQLWYSTYFSGFGIEGTAGYSYSNGASWTNAEGAIQDALDPDPLDGIQSHPIGRYARTNYGQAGDRLWVVGGEYYPWVAYCDDLSGDLHTWWGDHTLNMTYINLASAGSECLIYGQDGANERQYLRWDNGSVIFVPWEASFPADFVKGESWWTSTQLSHYITLGRTNFAPRYLLVSGDGGRSLTTLLYQATDPSAQEVLPYTALALDDGTVYLTGYKSEGTMVGGYIGQRQLLKASAGGGPWTLLLSQYAGWSGVGSYDLALRQSYSGELHLIRTWNGLEYGQKAVGNP